MEEKYYNIKAVTRREKEAALREALCEMGIEVMAVTQVEGSGIQEGVMSYIENGKGVLMLIPKIMVEIITTEENAVQKIIDMIVQTCRTGLLGDGKIFIEECNGSMIGFRPTEEKKQEIPLC